MLKSKVHVENQTKISRWDVGFVYSDDIFIVVDGFLGGLGVFGGLENWVHNCTAFVQANISIIQKHFLDQNRVQIHF